MSLGPKTKKLVRLLDDLAALLRSHGEVHWGKWMAEAGQRLSRSDFSGIQKLLAAYGGLGSFNDLVLQREGKMPAKANDRLKEMRSQAYSLAQEIKSVAELSNTKR